MEDSYAYPGKTFCPSKPNSAFPRALSVIPIFSLFFADHNMHRVKARSYRVVYMSSIPVHQLPSSVKACCQIDSTQDHVILQEDLNNLFDWSNTWQMKFNVDKCVIMNIGNLKITVNLVLVRTVKNNYFSLCTN